MRIFAIVFVSYFSLLAISPALCEVYGAIKQIDLCCDKADKECKAPVDKDSQPQKSSDNNCCIPCGTVQDCHCYFESTPQFDFIVAFSVTTEKNHLKNESLISNYSSDCWQPPELV